jgi:hypothetical protein
MPQQAGTGMRVAEELALRGAKEKKEIARLRRWCREISSQCRHGKSQREKEEEERTRRYAEQDAAKQREQMDAHAIMLERQRLEAERYKGNRLDGVLAKFEKQIDKQKKEVACPPPQAVLKLKQAVAMVTVQQAVAKVAEPRPSKWFYRLDAAEEEYLTSLFRKKLEGKKKGTNKDKAQGEQKRDHVTLQELKELMIACGGADVPLRYLRPQSAEYFERTQGVCRNPIFHPLSATCVCTKPLVFCKQPNVSLCKQPNVSISLNASACESDCCPGRWDGTRTLPGLHVPASTTKLTAVRRRRVENSTCKRSQSREKASGERRTSGVRYAYTLAKNMHAYAPARNHNHSRILVFLQASDDT